MAKPLVRFFIFAVASGFLLTATATAIAQSATSTLAEGDIVMNRSTLNVRAEAGTSAERVGRVPRRSFGMVTDGPEQADNTAWYEIEWTNGMAGWSDSRYLVKKASAGTALPTIEEPNGGEVLILGQTTPIELSFTEGAEPPVALSLMRSSRILGSLVVSTTSDSYTWEVGKYRTKSGIQTALAGLRYRIAVALATTPETVDMSDGYFEIKSTTQGANPTTTPTLSSLAPSSGPVNTSVTLRGSGFTASGNTVRFGSTAIANLSSTNGTSLAFSVPANAAAGATNVSVTNTNGASNTLTFRVDSSTTTGGTPTVKIFASPSMVLKGQSTTIIWSATGANGCVASGGSSAPGGSWSGDKPASGSETVTPKDHSNYVLTCYVDPVTRAGGAAANMVTVLMSKPDTTQPLVIVPLSFFSSPSTAAPYGNYTLSWSMPGTVQCIPYEEGAIYHDPKISDSESWYLAGRQPGPSGSWTGKIDKKSHIFALECITEPGAVDFTRDYYLRTIVSAEGSAPPFLPIAPINNIQTATVNVSITDSQFNPASVTVHAGDTVVWTNNGSQMHSLTWRDLDSSCGMGGAVSPGRTYRCAFDHVGSFGYFDSYNSGMSGTVTVTPPVITPITPPGQSGSVHIYALGTTGQGDMNLQINGSGIMANGMNNVFMDGTQITPGGDTTCYASPITSDNAGRWIPMLFYGSKPLTVGTQACAAAIPRALFYAGSHTLFLTNANGSSETITFNIPASAIPPGFAGGNTGSISDLIMSPVPDPSTTKFEIAFGADAYNNQSVVVGSVATSYPLPVPGNAKTNLIVGQGSLLRPDTKFELFNSDGTLRQTFQNAVSYVLGTVQDHACGPLGSPFSDSRTQGYQYGQIFVANQCVFSFNLDTSGMPVALYSLRAKNSNGAVSNVLTINVLPENGITAINNMEIRNRKFGGLAPMAVANEENTIDLYGKGFLPSDKIMINTALIQVIGLCTDYPGKHCVPLYSLPATPVTYIDSQHVRLTWTPAINFSSVPDAEMVQLSLLRQDKLAAAWQPVFWLGVTMPGRDLHPVKNTISPIAGPVGTTFTMCYPSVNNFSGNTARIDTQNGHLLHVITPKVSDHCFALKMGLLVNDPSWVLYQGNTVISPPTLQVTPGFYHIGILNDAADAPMAGFTVEITGTSGHTENFDATPPTQGPPPPLPRCTPEQWGSIFNMYQCAYYEQLGTQPLTRKAQFISQSVPSTMVAGRTYPVSITMKNTGTIAWDIVGIQNYNYALGSQNPQDNITWGGRIQLPAPVNPGDQTTLNFNVTAPSAPRTYDFQWRMVEENVEWFGEVTPNMAVVVTAP